MNVIKAVEDDLELDLVFVAWISITSSMKISVTKETYNLDFYICGKISSCTSYFHFHINGTNRMIFIKQYWSKILLQVPRLLRCNRFFKLLAFTSSAWTITILFYTIFKEKTITIYRQKQFLGRWIFMNEIPAYFYNNSFRSYSS